MRGEMPESLETVHTHTHTHQSFTELVDSLEREREPHFTEQIKITTLQN